MNENKKLFLDWVKKAWGFIGPLIYKFIKDLYLNAIKSKLKVPIKKLLVMN